MDSYQLHMDLTGMRKTPTLTLVIFTHLNEDVKVGFLVEFYFKKNLINHDFSLNIQCKQIHGLASGVGKLVRCVCMRNPFGLQSIGFLIKTLRSLSV